VLLLGQLALVFEFVNENVNVNGIYSDLEDYVLFVLGMDDQLLGRSIHWDIP